MPLKAAPPVLALALALLAGHARADCSVQAEPVAFGIIDVTRRSEGTGTVVVRCDGEASFEVGISGGSGQLRMDGPNGARLEYELYTGANHATRWGDGQGGGAARTGATDTDGSARLTIYGVVPAQPDTPAGDYSDSLTVTLSF